MCGKSLQKNSLKPDAASHNKASWNTGAGGFLEHSPGGESLYYKGPTLQKIILVLGGSSLVHVIFIFYLFQVYSIVVRQLHNLWSDPPDNSSAQLALYTVITYHWLYFIHCTSPPMTVLWRLTPFTFLTFTFLTHLPHPSPLWQWSVCFPCLWVCFCFVFLFCSLDPTYQWNIGYLSDWLHLHNTL